MADRNHWFFSQLNTRTDDQYRTDALTRQGA
jgi:hypothetical protein